MIDWETIAAAVAVKSYLLPFDFIDPVMIYNRFRVGIRNPRFLIPTLAAVRTLL
jgi:hypothetical protein